MTGYSSDFDALIKLIGDEQSFVLATHIQPDGDAIGSLLGLSLILKGMGKDVFCSWGEPILVPAQYSFLPGTELVQDPNKCPDDFDAFIALDCATIERLGSLAKNAKNSRHLVSIDHHSEDTRFATLNVVDKGAAATSEIVLRIGKALKAEISEDVATCLYVGLVTDTGRFQYSNTTAHTFEVAEALLGYGVRPNEIFQKVYENVSFGYLKLLGLALSRAVCVEDCSLVYTWVLQEDFKKTGAMLSEAENLIDSLRSVREARIAAILKEIGGGKINVSIRSKGNFNVSELAERFGGGGHRNAAGYRGRNSVQETLESLLKALRARG